MTGINESGTIAGYYTDDFSTSSTEYGFIRRRVGVVKTIAVAGSAETQIKGINEKGGACARIRFKCGEPTPFPTFSVLSAARQVLRILHRGLA